MKDLSKKQEKAGMIAIFVLIAAVVLGLVIQFLWNQALAPALGTVAISFWQAVGLFLLAKLFFGFGSEGSGRFRGRFKSKRRERDKTLSDPAFRDYWDNEGKAAFETYLANRGD